ncbi:S8 family serine peptidase [Rossellomorea vietnamensis]|uniref:S8 family serine peptidase n=1 Tax=Rossellomorea vietnamensis TaxID=218284 RepID=A0A5D4MCB0_9BACI|nr:S8 family serine peptidase [Rossellomorea vietnamensis]TYR98953.1 S8 family serine peptidase [Rossellomorea vietnamensis]
MKLYLFSILLTLSLVFSFVQKGTTAENEWIVYFTDEESAQQFSELNPVQVLSTHGSILRVEGLSESYLKSYPNVTGVESNHIKRAADYSFNDPYLSNQWYLDRIKFKSVTEMYPAPPANLLKNKEAVTGSESFIYKESPVSSSLITFPSLNQTLNRVSISLVEAEGQWTFTVKDSNGTVIGRNTGTSDTLDILIPEKNYKSLILEISTATQWKTPPSINRITGVNNTRIGVLDSGVSQHEDFCGNILYSLGKNYKDSKKPPYDQYGHGTHVTGIIGGCSNNKIGISGVTGNAPVDIIPFKVLDDLGAGGDFEISQGIEDAIKMNIDILNLSLSGQGETTMLENAVKKAYLSDILIVAAAGNYNTSTKNVFPASYPYVFTVASVDERLQRVPSSDYGWEVDISAPGKGIFSTYLDNSYHHLTGTSMATPIVSGAAALALEKHQGFSITELRNQLSYSADDLMSKGFDVYSGTGLINFSKLNDDFAPEPMEWLNAREGQPHTENKFMLALSKKLLGKDLYIFNNEKLITHKTVNSVLENVTISPSSDKSKSKILVMVMDKGEVIGMKYTYLNNDNAAPISYSDVSQKYWAYTDIMESSMNGYIHGHDNKLYKPKEYISRRHATMMMNRLFRWETLQVTTSPFIDVSSEINSINLSMLSAYEEKVIKGYPDNKFYPENNLTRGQMALILARALKVDRDPLTGAPYSFKDVSSESETFISITNLAELGIITKQDYFKPSDNINRAQFAAMVRRTHDYLNK